MTLVQDTKTLLRRYLADEKGLSAVEYGLLAAGIAIGLYLILSGIGVDLRAIFNSVKGDLDTAAKPAG
jgi:pilus assembly protein Flp/PilA